MQRQYVITGKSEEEFLGKILQYLETKGFQVSVSAIEGPRQTVSGVEMARSSNVSTRTIRRRCASKRVAQFIERGPSGRVNAIQDCPFTRQHFRKRPGSGQQSEEADTKRPTIEP